MSRITLSCFLGYFLRSFHSSRFFGGVFSTARAKFSSVPGIGSGMGSLTGLPLMTLDLLATLSSLRREQSSGNPQLPRPDLSEQIIDDPIRSLLRLLQALLNPVRIFARLRVLNVIVSLDTHHRVWIPIFDLPVLPLLVEVVKSPTIISESSEIESWNAMLFLSAHTSSPLGSEWSHNDTAIISSASVAGEPAGRYGRSADGAARAP